MSLADAAPAHLYAVIVIPFGVFLALGIALLVHGRKRSRAFWEYAT